VAALAEALTAAESEVTVAMMGVVGDIHLGEPVQVVKAA